LLESLTEAHAYIRQGIDPNLLAREKTVQQRLNARAEELLKRGASGATETQLAASKRELDTLTTDLQQVQTQIRQASPRYAALTQPQPLSAAEIQQQVLDADTLLLEYSLGDERSFLWAVTPTAVNSYELPKREVVEAAAQRVYDLLADTSGVRGQTAKPRDLRLKEASGQYLAAAASLSQMLLGPVAGQLGKKRLVIVADGILQYIPFAALPDPNRPTDGKENGQPLIVEHEVVNLPSASTLAVLRRELAGRKPAPKTLAVLADPVFMSNDERVKRRVNQPAAKPDESVTGLVQQRILKQLGRERDELHISRLPFTRQEAEQIMALAPAGAGMKALDFEASCATAMSDQLSQYRYVHFATHGLADSERPELSTIVLSLFDEQGRPQDGFLRAHEVYNLNLPAEMVVLSACETGLGKLTKGEGLVSLTRGFMYAGAARVVVSLWSVNDRATAELMTKFYRRVLVEGERPAAALRAAQIEMWRDKRWEAPYYWAAFTLQGEWR
jgi:CHAT domain-containing protein